MRALRILALLLLAGPALHAASNNKLVRVPQDAKTLDAAIDRVADGGVIEMAAGTYASPPNGFTINNERKGFTVRPAAGATVVLDGGGSRKLLRFVNSDRARGKAVTFERITFQNGFSADGNVSGGVTLSKAEALFRDCRFVNNRAAAPMSGGGAVKALAGSRATFVDCSFRGNSSPNRGGAIAMVSAEVTIQGGELVGNRTNLPGHQPGSYGGALMVLDSRLRVADTRFEGNEAGWVAGAIYVNGSWDKGADVLITDASFIANQAVPDPCCDQGLELTAGAIDVEDRATVRIHRSLFVRNRADVGGAVNNYRADVEIHGSVFQANQTTQVRPERGVGGAIAVLSTDHVDLTTNGGAINRPSARQVVTNSLIQGGSDAPRAFRNGACIAAGGDGHRQYGGGPVPQAGTLAENRARLEIRGVVFSDCDVERVEAGDGFGGALSGDLIELLVEDSMFLDSDARGADAGGGAIFLRQESNARIVRTTFARNSAQRSGGAIFVGGSTAQVDDCRFFANDVMPGVSEALNDSRGAAIFSIPHLDPIQPRNVGGVVSNSVFSENLGLLVWDVDPQSGAINEMRYDNNRFHTALFGNRVYFNSLAAPGGATVAELNGMTVQRGVRGSTRKSEVPNAFFFSPREGSLRSVPSPNSVGAGAPAPTASLLAYAWSGGSAAIGTFPLSQQAGLLEVQPGDYTLAVNGAAVAQIRALGTCTAGPFLCLNGNRFRAEVTWKAGGASGPAQAVALTGDTGYFWFFDPSNVELVVKVLDGRTLNGHFWVFYGALSNVEYTLTITDTVTGAVKTYSNPSGRFASAGDTSAFAASKAAGQALQAEAGALGDALAELVPIAGEASTCAAGPASLCLNGSRFRVELAWKDFAGRTGTGQAVPLTGDTGYFYFTSANNVEVVLKVLDGRPLNGHFWVFYGALTNQEYTITVTDTVTGAKKTYFNPSGKFGSQGDTAALPSP